MGGHSITLSTPVVLARSADSPPVRPAMEVCWVVKVGSSDAKAPVAEAVMVKLVVLPLTERMPEEDVADRLPCRTLFSKTCIEIIGAA